MKIKFLSAFLITVVIIIVLSPVISFAGIPTGKTADSDNSKIISVADSNRVIFSEDDQDAILVVVKDSLGNEDYSKVIIVNEKNNFVVNPSKKLAAGVYYVISSSHKNRLYNQKITVKEL